MMCSCAKCDRLDEWGACTMYSEAGQAWRQKMGYCPVIDNDPDRDTRRQLIKKRIGQQKQRRFR